jgi:arylsulfatase A-like enzyme
MPKKKPNLLFFGIDSLCRKHMSLYGYHRLTTPHIDNYLKDGIVFEQCFSPSIPTPPGYSSMLTGMDSFSTHVVALRHKGKLPEYVKTLQEMLRDQGYTTSCIGYPNFTGFDTYLNFSGWGSWDDGRSHKAENLNNAALPELDRLAAQDKPWMLFLRHMDPHSPYLAPEPFHKMFFQGNEFDPNNKSLEPVMNFKPFCDYFATWFPPGCTSSDYIVAQYDAEIAYMDSCIQILFEKINALGLEEDTVVVFSSDHGETLYEHECWFDHHGLYECTLSIPFAIKFPGNHRGGHRVPEICQHKDIVPTLLDIMGIDTGITFDGRSLMPLVQGGTVPSEPNMYITECTWMRKHGWRTPEWKLIVALEPDFHYKPEVELYNLRDDPGEHVNLAEARPDIVARLRVDMLAHIEKRTQATGREAPIYTNTAWNGHGKPFESADEAYNTLHIGDVGKAKKLQEESKK